MTVAVQWLSWRDATTRALYGETGFYRRLDGPAAHFRTSVTASALFARAVARLLTHVDNELGHPDVLDLVDVGAGHGWLLSQVRATAAPQLRTRLRLTGVEVAPRPAELTADVAWVDELPMGVRGVVVANEWLDDIPVDIVQRTDDGIRIVVVDPASGEERLGEPVSPEDAAWLDAWWPLEAGEQGDRAEVGRPRDEAWADTVTALEAGLTFAVDYSHTLADRATGLLPAGTLTGYRDGRAVAPLPDGSCDVTCHVALDACAVAGERAGAGQTALLSQREALRALGLDGGRPDRTLARRDPEGYLQALVYAGEAAELTAIGGLGDFGWLIQAVGVALPEELTAR